MFINIRHNCVFQENYKKFFYRRKPWLCKYIYAAEPPPNFQSGKSNVEKITMFTF